MGARSGSLRDSRAGRSSVTSAPDSEQEVSPLELLFDLVFVLGVSQLTRHLVARPTWRGATETLVLYLPMFAVWFYTSWAATLYSLRHPRARRMMIAVMIADLFAFTTFPGEIWRTPRSWVEASYPNVVYFNEVDRGGHFAAWEEPELFSKEMRAAFTSVR